MADEQLAQCFGIDPSSPERCVKATPAATMRCLEAQVNGRRESGVRSEDGVGELEEGVAPAGEALVIERVAEVVESIGRFHGAPIMHSPRALRTPCLPAWLRRKLSLEDCRASAWAVAFDGERYRGAEAINVVISGAIGTRIPHTLYKLPLIGDLQDLAYGWIAANRRRLPGDKPYCSQYPSNCQ